MSRRKRNGNGEDGGESGLGNHSVPFKDANLELGEIPLDNIDTFVIPARDEKGSFTTIHVNVPPYLYRQLQVIVKSGRFPYLDVSDLVRHSMVRHLKFCVDIRESIPKDVYTGTEAIMEVCRDNELRLRVASAFEEIDRQITGHLERLEISDAIRLLTILKNRIDVIPSSPRQHTLRSGILRRFGYILEHNGAVRPMSEEEKAQTIPDSPDGHSVEPDDNTQGGKEVAKRGGYQ